MLSLIMQLLGIVSALDFLRPYLLPTQFNAWQGLLRDPIDWAPVVRAAWVSALFGDPRAGLGVHPLPAAGCDRRVKLIHAF